MTEEEWATTTDPRAFDIPRDATQRKLRLFLVACCRRIFHLIPEGAGRTALEIAEAYADNLASDRTRQKAQREAAAELTRRKRERRTGGVLNISGLEAEIAGLDAVLETTVKTISHRASYQPDAAAAQGQAARRRRTGNDPYAATYQAELASQVPLLRDIFGNPFRPVAFHPRWRSESAVALARTAYDTRNFTLLPILADALEEAGCDHADVLAHCRDHNGVHVRGCWVVDGVLGKT